MRIGSVVEIKKYDVMPRIVGEYAEIVDVEGKKVFLRTRGVINQNRDLFVNGKLI